MGRDGAPIPDLRNLQRVGAVCTYDANRMTSFLLGDPPKRVVKRLVRSMPGHAVRCDYLAYYDMIVPLSRVDPRSYRRSSERLRLGNRP